MRTQNFLHEAMTTPEIEHACWEAEQEAWWEALSPEEQEAELAWAAMYRKLEEEREALRRIRAKNDSIPF